MSRRAPGLAAVVAASIMALAACNYLPTEPSLPFSRTDLRVGTGSEVTTGRTVVAHLQGWIHNADRPEQKGIQFTTTVDGFPAFFIVGGGDVITGINLGVIGMREGGLRRLVIPPTLAYGSTGFGVIPPYSNLIFEVDLLEVL
jgi:FKBP-type peptidyl-prolyl cis-trans isomerase